MNTKARKTGLIAFVIIMCVVLVAGAFVACSNYSDDIIGGSDGPTSIFVSKDTENLIKNLYNCKIKYVGNNSGVAKIVGLLPFAEGVNVNKIELQTESEPYGITLNYVIDDYEKVVIDDTVKFDKFNKNAMLMFCLIDNVESITINVKDEIKYKGAMYSSTYLRTDFDKTFEKPLREYCDNLESFKMLFTSISLKNDITDINSAVSNVILSENVNSYGKGECASEGHIVLGATDSKSWNSSDGRTKFIEAYVLVTYGEYGFENGDFIKISGSGVIPTRITFEIYADGRYNLIEYKEAMDGSEYIPSIKEMFPEKYWSRALSTIDVDYTECKKQEKVYAQAYLKSIGRDAKIGNYADFEHQLPNMNVDASNTLGSKYYDYPYWIGTHEKIENGVRYVYEKLWNDKGNGDGIVTFTKYEFDSKIVVQETVIEIKNGEMVYLKGTPWEENDSKHS